MKFTISSISVIAISLLLAGCSRDLITVMSQETHSDVFEEISGEYQIPSGYAGLIILSSLKTIKPGIYPLEGKTVGTPDYRLLINIDGQVAFVRGTVKEENSEPRGLDDSEAGDGMRYHLQQELILRAGHHKVFITIPEDGAAMERDLNLQAGKVNVLKLDPQYGSTSLGGKKGLGLFSSSSFTEGIDGFFASLNGNDI